MADLSHFVGGDLSIGPAGDLAIADDTLETRQRVLRRLCTNAGAVLHHLDYGAGLPARVGDPLNGRAIAGVVLSQMLLEQAVQQTPPPVVTVRSQPNALSVDLNYVDAIAGQGVAQGFDITSGI